ncbi:2Fe-2S iron-sulfur cluster-binding protein [Bradyrhizobium sp. WD16]|uniref:2Fe-2S iron-sulfur cluster-binding protein n=1 Tax=Bradyrhizobium sp. WD16 TaxID=1521768 RepID=UPI0020A2D6A6|nr:2Fe-2S iron-sulfur cluster-binding protein [Bradyrhizobium sp. WD16]UTD29843.1 ferredoxin [Bradyrhizobium sp. WD16]
MPSITFIHPDGRAETIGGNDGDSAMHIATMNGVGEIVAECGGNAMCATCHVYVDEEWQARLPQPSDDEIALLEGVAAEQRPNSRLSCQIKLTPALDGLVLHLPDKQT